MSQPESRQADPAQAEAADRRTARRRLVKAGLAALPAVLTLRSYPAWGQTVGPGGTKVTGPSGGGPPTGDSEADVQAMLQQAESWQSSAGPSRREWWTDESSSETLAD